MLPGVCRVTAGFRVAMAGDDACLRLGRTGDGRTLSFAFASNTIRHVAASVKTQIAHATFPLEKISVFLTTRKFIRIGLNQRSHWTHDETDFACRPCCA
ncbi:protein of unknown function [Pararobbsia alpina]